MVLAVYSVGRSTWYRGVAEVLFPKPVAVSARTKGYAVEAIKALMGRDCSPMNPVK
jgi:predicted DNA-binding transcriptional regulator AlpA